MGTRRKASLLIKLVDTFVQKLNDNHLEDVLLTVKKQVAEVEYRCNECMSYALYIVYIHIILSPADTMHTYNIISMYTTTDMWTMYTCILTCTHLLTVSHTTHRYIHICIYAHIYIHTHAYTQHTYTRVHPLTHNMHTHHTQVCTHTYTREHAHTHIHTYVHTHIHTYTHARTTHTYVYTYTHARTTHMHAQHTCSTTHMHRESKRHWHMNRLACNVTAKCTFLITQHPSII